MKTKRSDLINQYIDTFPVLPVTVTRLMQVTGNPECSVRDVVDTIHSDQSLCLTILKIANSVLFGRPQKVDSIQMAVVILGFNEVQRIAMAKALFNSFGKIAKQNQAFVDRFWHHSFVCGMAAKVIGWDNSIAPDIAFMGGIIHDIGKLIMLETFGDEYAPEQWLMGLSNEERLEEELQTFSFTHDMLGGKLLQKWLFPENLISAVACHHRPFETTKEKGFAHVIQLADILSFYCCNQDQLGEGGVLAAIHSLLPRLQSQWQRAGFVLKDAAIAEWFNWLINNDEQSSGLREAFSA